MLSRAQTVMAIFLIERPGYLSYMAIYSYSWLYAYDIVEHCYNGFMYPYVPCIMRNVFHDSPPVRLMHLVTYPYQSIEHYQMVVKLSNGFWVAIVTPGYIAFI